MNEEEKLEFISNIKYFWYEKGDIERFVDYSPEKLREADPIIASAYEDMKIATETFERVMGGQYE